MSDDLMDALGAAVKGKLCEVSTCTANPVAKRNGRKLCTRHRDHYDHSTMGEPCERCDSRQWVETPNAKTAAVCAICEYAEYDEGVIEGSW